MDVSKVVGIETAIGCHTFRATGIMDCLTNGGCIEVAQRMAGHSNAKRPASTTGATMTSALAKWSGSEFEATFFWLVRGICG
jgi:integrase